VIFGSTKNAVLLCAEPAGTVTLMGPDVAPSGTTALRRLLLTNVTDVAGVPLKLTLALLTKPLPLTVTLVPWTALAGEKLVTFGAETSASKLLDPDSVAGDPPVSGAPAHAVSPTKHNIAHTR
jgi:hypothetical protein